MDSETDPANKEHIESHDRSQHRCGPVLDTAEDPNIQEEPSSHSGQTDCDMAPLPVSSRRSTRDPSISSWSTASTTASESTNTDDSDDSDNSTSSRFRDEFAIERSELEDLFSEHIAHIYGPPSLSLRLRRNGLSIITILLLASVLAAQLLSQRLSDPSYPSPDLPYQRSPNGTLVLPLAAPGQFYPLSHCGYTPATFSFLSRPSDSPDPRSTFYNISALPDLAGLRARWRAHLAATVPAAALHRFAATPSLDDIQAHRGLLTARQRAHMVRWADKERRWLKGLWHPDRARARGLPVWLVEGWFDEVERRGREAVEFWKEVGVVEEGVEDVEELFTAEGE